MKIFVTGCASFVGKELLRQCRSKKIETTGVDLLDLAQSGFGAADICSRSISRYIPDDTDALIHLAALSRDADCKDNAYNCFNANVMGTLNLINAAKEKGVKQFIFASSEWVYGDFKEGEIKNEDSIIDAPSLKSEYALSKLVSELNLKQKFGNGFCPITILRFGIIYGPRTGNWSAVEALYNDVKMKDTVKVGSLKTARRFIHVSDIASGIISSIGRTGYEIFNLTGARLISLGDIIKASAEILKKDIKIIEENPSKVSIRNPDNAKAVSTLRWKPVIDLKQGLASLDRDQKTVLSGLS